MRQNLVVFVITVVVLLSQIVESLEGNGSCNCFNCMLTDNKCRQHAECSKANGKCICPTGWGSDDCRLPLCGSLDMPPEDRTPLPLDGSRGKQCQCNDGWSGVNCQVCQNDNVCTKFLDPEGIAGQNATCYKGAIPVHSNYQQCQIVNVALKNMLDGKHAYASFNCDVQPKAPDNIPNVCRFQFWLDDRESFYCRMTDCEFDQQQLVDGYNVTGGLCKNIDCQCIHDELLCGKGIYDGVDVDLQGVFDDLVRGPASLICKKPDGFRNADGPYNCEFDEPGLRDSLGLLLGNNPVIELQCDSGECLFQSEVPGYVVPAKPADWTKISTLIALSVILFLLTGYLIYWSIRRMERERLYRQVGSEFESREEEERARQLEKEIMQGHRLPATQVFRNICYEITGNNLGSSSSSTVSRKRVLRGIYGCVKPGEMMAIMGSSGAGKTTCLDILAGKPKKGIVTGNLYINNKTPTRAEFKQITGYVDQEDSLLPTLTVYETLLCSALLRLPRSMSYEMKVRRVRDVLAELGIEHIANNRVGGSSSLSSFFSSSGSGGGGDNGSSSRGLSGGERRRVSIALETIPSPSLLYLDEPTSGLDSYNAFSVVYNLKKLAVNYGRTIVLSLHQPRSDIFNMFDRLLLLGEGGYMVYSGRLQSESSLSSSLLAEKKLADEAAIEALVQSGDSIVEKYLKEIGLKCPTNCNIADYLIDITSRGYVASAVTQSNVKSSADGVSQPLVNDMSQYYIKPQFADMTELSMMRPNLYKLVDSFYSSQICKELKDEIHQVLRSARNSDRDESDAEQMDVDQSNGPRYSTMRKNMSKAKLNGSGDDDSELSDSLPLLTQKEQTSVSSGRLPLDQPLDEDDQLLISTLPSSESSSTVKDHLITVWHSLIRLTRPTAVSAQSKPGFYEQFKILSWRTVINFYRNPFLMYGHYGIAILLAVLSGLLFWQVRDDLGGFQNRLGVFFFILAVFGFSSLSSLEVFSKERALFVRERSAGFYGVGVYFITKIIFDILPLRVIPPVLLGAISYYMIGLTPAAYTFCKFLLVLVLFNLTAAGICLVIAVLCGNHLSLANLIAVMWMLFSMLFGGFLLNKDNIHPAFQWLPYLSFYNFAFEALIVNELIDISLSDKQVGIPIQVPGTVILKTFGFNKDNFWPDVFSLVYMFIVFIVVAFIFLQLLVKEKR
ncbi:hypothetical protein MP228_002569 [Amoeboaphelidium protococcarum]|nr:hypothetical protein MP228_002569 [Amoeboaphelidium protococcarum]